MKNIVMVLLFLVACSEKTVVMCENFSTKAICIQNNTCVWFMDDFGKECCDKTDKGIGKYDGIQKKKDRCP